MIKIVFRIVLIVAATQASAQPADDGTSSAWVKRQIGRSYMCNSFTGHCEWEPRYGYTRIPIYTHPYRPSIGHIPYRQAPVVPRLDALNEGPRCLNVLMSAVGPEAYDATKAKEAADSMLMEAIRAKHGSRMMDLRHSEMRSYECWRSATGNRQSEKLADLGGSELHQCSVTARPCRSKQEIADTDDPRTNAMIRTLQERGYDVRVTEPENPDAKRKPRLLRRLLKRD